MNAGHVPWSRPGTAMLLAAAAGVTVTLSFFIGARALALASYRSGLEADVSTRARLLEQQLREAELAGRAVAGFLALPEEPVAQRLEAFAGPLLSGDGGLQSFGWAPVVERHELAAYESHLRRESPGARVFELAPDGTRRPVGERPFYVPLTYTVPAAFAASPGEGFDVASSPERAAVVLRSCETGLPAVTKPIELRSDGRGNRFVLFFPVGGAGWVPRPGARCLERLRGYAIAVVFADALVASALAKTHPVGLPFVLIDPAAPEPEQLVLRWNARLQPRPTWRDRLYSPVEPIVRDFTLGDRRWRLVVTPNAAYLETNHPLVHWAALPVGLLVTLLGSTFAYSALSRRAALATTNAELQAALASVRTLQGLLPICAHCKRIRDDHGEWTQVETYVRDHTDARFSHGICPDCMAEHYPNVSRRDV